MAGLQEAFLSKGSHVDLKEYGSHLVSWMNS